MSCVRIASMLSSLIQPFSSCAVANLELGHHSTKAPTSMWPRRLGSRDFLVAFTAAVMYSSLTRDPRIWGSLFALNAGAPPATPATLGTKRAFATVVLVAPEAEDLLDGVRAAIGERGAASAWSGKLVARLIATDGFGLRKSLIPALTALAGGGDLPKTWSF